jgi:hypothetical protein
MLVAADMDAETRCTVGNQLIITTSASLGEG